jgi:thioredoxin-like negative regulator of GroEL
LEEVKKVCTDKCVMLLFWAEWHEPCHILRDQMAELAKLHKEIKFTWVRLSITQYMPV